MLQVGIWCTVVLSNSIFIIDLDKTIGISFAISMDGELVMKGGIGLSDVENGTLMTSKTILRIASISKSLTSVAVGK